MSKKERQQRQQQRLHKKQHITMYKYEGRYSLRYRIIVYTDDLLTFIAKTNVVLYRHTYLSG